MYRSVPVRRWVVVGLCFVSLLGIASAIAGYQAAPSEAASAVVATGSTTAMPGRSDESHAQWAIVALLVVGGMLVLFLPRRQTKEQTSQD